MDAQENNSLDVEGLKNHIVPRNVSKDMNNKSSVDEHKDYNTHASLGFDAVTQAANYVRSRSKHSPTVGIICGSGLGGLADLVQEANIIDYKDIPHFLVSTVPGHAGRLVLGYLKGVCVVCMQGRVHLYEGHPAARVAFPVRVMKEIGISTLVVTNAVGALKSEFEVGDIMVIMDHISFPSLMGLNPLIGQRDQKLGTPFLSMTNAYDRDLRKLTFSVAQELGYDFVKEGILSVVAGPSYETVSECRLLRFMGADVVGMSVSPEVLVARQVNLRVLALSLITNLCAMEHDTDISANHEEVLEVGRSRADDMQYLVSSVVSKIK